MIFVDTLSRAHLKEDGEEINEEEINAQIHMICSNTASDEKMRKIQEMTQKDDSRAWSTEDIHHKWMAKTEK